MQIAVLPCGLRGLRGEFIECPLSLTLFHPYFSSSFLPASSESKFRIVLNTRK